MLQAGSVGLLGLGMNHVAALREARATPAPTAGGGKAKSVIFIFLSGGAPQHDTFDPKPALAKYEGRQLPNHRITERKTGAAFPSPFKFFGRYVLKSRI